MLASASQDATLRRWDLRTGRQLGGPITGQNNSVWGVAFSPDGKTIASASPGGSIQRTDARTGQRLGPPLSTGWVEAVAFSPDGSVIAAGAKDGRVQLWPLSVQSWIRHACVLAARNLRMQEWTEFIGAQTRYE